MRGAPSCCALPDFLVCTPSLKFTAAAPQNSGHVASPTLSRQQVGEVGAGPGTARGLSLRSVAQMPGSLLPPWAGGIRGFCSAPRRLSVL